MYGFNSYYGSCYPAPFAGGPYPYPYPGGAGAAYALLVVLFILLLIFGFWWYAGWCARAY
ncbi:YjcZ family sporulation protein [Peribacillus kribbensis]|uniref:YjcZ family sporulation protein n=1 Tax=Peribacillus kribbensis TaxID=356658 RepID=UPI00042702EC|nr:YjcZ family sporulation protein [Peribacillus kribbensis]